MISQNKGEWSELYVFLSCGNNGLTISTNNVII